MTFIEWTNVCLQCGKTSRVTQTPHMTVVPKSECPDCFGPVRTTRRGVTHSGQSVSGGEPTDGSDI